jgi:hypothetical protein
MHTIETALELVAVILLAVLGRAVFLYFSPYRQCRWWRRRGTVGGRAVAAAACSAGACSHGRPATGHARGASAGAGVARARG